MQLKKVLSIQYLRGIAALMVVFHHTRNPQDWLFNPFEGYKFGAAGVDIFFVISGFIMYTAARHENIGEFVSKRIVRVAPLYWLATFAFLMLSLVLTPHAVSGSNVGHLLMSLFFIPHESPVFPGNTWPLLVQGWTLNFEMFFYALFAVGIFAGRPAEFTVGAVVFLVVLGLVLPSSSAVYSTYTSPLLLEFASGIIIGYLYVRRDLSRLYPLLPLGFAALVLGASPMVPDEFRETLRILPAAAVIVGAIGMERHLSTPNAALKLLGDASYSIYLSHTLVLAALFGVWKRLPLDGWLQLISLVLIAMAICVAVGVAIHIFIERPMLRALRPKRSVPAEAEA